jgi:DNA repair exonuclease SbcCD ATPase subunit
VKKIDFKKVRAKNFFCYGKDGIEIDFKKYGNVVVINGRNLDIQDEGEENKHSSNGVGKSSIIDALVYGLYGKTVKNPVKIKQADIINNVTSKQMEVEVCWDDYKVIRTRKPDGLRLWKGADEITLGGMPATQKEIENILGLNYDTFVNICVFTDDNSVSFLECDKCTCSVARSHSY